MIGGVGRVGGVGRASGMGSAAGGQWQASQLKASSPPHPATRLPSLPLAVPRRATHIVLVVAVFIHAQRVLCGLPAATAATAACSQPSKKHGTVVHVGPSPLGWQALRRVTVVLICARPPSLGRCGAGG